MGKDEDNKRGSKRKADDPPDGTENNNEGPEGEGNSAPKTPEEVMWEVMETSMEQLKQRIEVLENLLITKNHEMTELQDEHKAERDSLERDIRQLEAQLRAANKKVETRDKKLKDVPKQIKKQQEDKHKKSLAREEQKTKAATKKLNDANKKLKVMVDKTVNPLKSTVAEQKAGLTQLKFDYMEALRTIDKLRKQIKSQEARIQGFDESRLAARRENVDKRIEYQRLQLQKKELEYKIREQEKQNKEDLMRTQFRLRTEKARADFQLKAEAKAKEQEDRANRLKTYVGMRDQERAARMGQFPTLNGPSLNGNEPNIAEALAAYYREQAANARNELTSPAASLPTSAAAAAAVPTAASLPTPVTSNQSQRTPRGRPSTAKKPKKKKSSSKKKTPARKDRNLEKGQLTLTQMEFATPSPPVEAPPPPDNFVAAPSLVPGYNLVVNETTREIFYENITTGERTTTVPTAPAGSVAGPVPDGTSIASDAAVNGLDVGTMMEVVDGMSPETAVDLVGSDDDDADRKPTPEEKAAVEAARAALNSDSDDDDDDDESDDSSVDLVEAWKAEKARIAKRAEANREEYKDDNKKDDNDDDKMDEDPNDDCAKKLFK